MLVFVHEFNHKMILRWFMWKLHKNTYLALAGYVNLSAMIATFRYQSTSKESILFLLSAYFPEPLFNYPYNGSK